MTDCVLCDWEFSLSDPAWVVFGAPLEDFSVSIFPLAWTPEGPRPIPSDTPIGDPTGMRAIATVAHWAQEHPQQLTLALGHGFVLKRL